MTAESVISEWLSTLCGMSPGVTRAVVLIAPGGDAPEPSQVCWPEPPAPSRELDALASAALSGDAPIDDYGRDPSTSGSTSILRAAQPLPRIFGRRGAVAIEIAEAKPDALILLRERLRTSADWLALLARQKPPTERLAHGLELMSRALERVRFVDAAREVATDAAARFGCERVAVGRTKRSHLELVALSHNASFDPRSNRVRDMLAAMEEACDQDATIAVPAPPAFADRVAVEHARLLERHALQATCSVPLACDGEVIGALHFEWSEQSGPPSAATLAGCEDAGALLGPLFARIEAADASVFERSRTQVGRGLRWLFQPRQLAAKLSAAALVLTLIVIAALPGRHRIPADASLEGRVRRAVVAGVDGFLSEVHARPGDEVAAGQILARLDQQDLALELQSLKAKREQTRSELREARAQHDLARMSILAAQIAQVEAELGLLAANLERTELVAPFDGIIVRGDPSQQVGGPVERGEVLFELAPLDGYRIVLQVSERDVRFIEAGQRGELALAAIPGAPRELVVERVTPVAVAEEGQNLFRVEAGLVEADNRLRPGMEGVAKIHAGEARRVWLWTHDLLERLRLWLWGWWF